MSMSTLSSDPSLLPNAIVLEALDPPRGRALLLLGGRGIGRLPPLLAQPSLQVVDVVINLVADDGWGWPNAEPAPPLPRARAVAELRRRRVLGGVVVQKCCRVRHGHTVRWGCGERCEYGAE